jgi:serine/threonine-protein kinase HipA
MKLKIYHNRTLVGFLQSTEGGIAFQYDETYLNAPGSYPISLSLPLQTQPLPFRQTERFFEGLLPEGDERTRVARYLQVSSASLLKLLEALAGDCVGNLTVLTESQDIEQLYQSSGYVPLSSENFDDIIGNDVDLITKLTADNRLSIPGAQTKIGLYCNDDPTAADAQWFIPKGLATSNYIIKPSSKLYHSTALNEYFCTKLAQRAGISTAEIWLLSQNDNPVLISKRFDRESFDEPLEGSRATDRYLARLCQEDFCQALSVSPNHKYQADGGPGFAQILNVLRFETSPADVQSFIRIFLFNYLIGNCDAHAKNYSIFRRADGSLGLTPAYDLVSTTLYPNLTRNVAIAVGNVYGIDRIGADDFKRLCEQTSIAWSLIERTISDLAESLLSGIDEVFADVADKGFVQDGAQLSSHLKAEVSARASL